MIAWAALDPAIGGVMDEGGDRVVPAASTIKLFVYSAFRRSRLDPGETVPVRKTGGPALPGTWKPRSSSPTTPS